MKKYYSLTDYEVFDWALDIQNLLPSDLKQNMDKLIGDIRILDDFHFKVNSNLSKVLNKLSVKQYSGIGDLFADEKYNASDAYFEGIDNFPVRVFKIINDQKAGKKAATLYADFKSMKSKTALEEQPDLWTDADRIKSPSLSTVKWQEKYTQYNSEARLKFNYDQKLKSEFMTTVRKALLKFLPDIQNFGPDEIIVYNNALSILYETYKSICETLIKRIDYGLLEVPFELWDYEKVLEKKISKLSKAKKAAGDAKQKMRWMGEKK